MPNDDAEAQLWYHLHGAVTLELGFGREKDSDGLGGHVVTIIDKRWLVDASLEQATNDALLIRLPPVLSAMRITVPLIRHLKIVMKRLADAASCTASASRIATIGKPRTGGQPSKHSLRRIVSRKECGAISHVRQAKPSSNT